MDSAPHAASATHPAPQPANAQLHHLTLASPFPYDAAGLFTFLSARAIHGVESADLTDPTHLRYARTLALPHGPAHVEVSARRREGGGAASPAWELTARVQVAAQADVAEVERRLHHLLDLRTDPAEVDTALRSDPSLAPSVRANPGMRVPGTPEPEELVVRALVGG